MPCPRIYQPGGGSGGGGVSTGITVPVKGLDIDYLILPTTTADLIDGQVITDQSLYLFTNLTTDNNKIYLATVVGINVTWDIQSLFYGSSDAPIDGSTVYVQTGDFYADNTLLYQGTEFVNFLDNKVSFTIPDNSAATTFVSVDTDKYNNFLMEYSVFRGSAIVNGFYFAASNGVTSNGVNDPKAIIGVTGVTFSVAFSAPLMMVKYASTSTGSDATLKRVIRIW